MLVKKLRRKRKMKRDQLILKQHFPLNFQWTTQSYQSVIPTAARKEPLYQIVAFY
jgi:hypothetical protein